VAVEEGGEVPGEKELARGGGGWRVCRRPRYGKRDEEERDKPGGEAEAGGWGCHRSWG